MTSYAQWQKEVHWQTLFKHISLDCWFTGTMVGLQNMKSNFTFSRNQTDRCLSHKTQAPRFKYYGIWIPGQRDRMGFIVGEYGHARTNTTEDKHIKFHNDSKMGVISRCLA